MLDVAHNLLVFCSMAFAYYHGSKFLLSLSCGYYVTSPKAEPILVTNFVAQQNVNHNHLAIALASFQPICILCFALKSPIWGSYISSTDHFKLVIFQGNYHVIFARHSCDQKVGHFAIISIIHPSPLSSTTFIIL